MSELSSKRPIVHGRIISSAYNERDGGGGKRLGHSEVSTGQHLRLCPSNSLADLFFQKLCRNINYAHGNWPEVGLSRKKIEPHSNPVR